ncbi:unnamed protein product [Leptosia nina]|uniref:Uncharacterized protein n=1 Tax=Leptosia nina TaxID=320188 RepID=A0AAV1J9G9_9NEOP
MRTYSRKPPEHHIIEGVLELCRLCLHEVNKPIHIFMDDDNKYCKFLPMRIMICLGLEITNEECLPKIICSQCLKDLNSFYDFKKRCTLSYQKLKSHYLAVKQKEVSKTQTKMEKESLLNSHTPEVDSKVGIDNNKEKEVVLSLTEGNALEVISIFNQATVPSRQNSEHEQVQTVTSYNVNDGLNFLNVGTSPPIPPIPEDVTSFLSTILVQLGVLTKDNENIAVVDQTFKNVRLETNDGSVMLELVEEEDSPIKKEPEQEKMPNGKFDFVYDANKGIPTVKAMCGTCGKKFASRGAMLRHDRTHKGIRPYVCEICDKAFTQREVLRRHMHLHQPERPFKCGSCDKGFTQRAALRSHELTNHAPTRPLSLYRCKLCPKMFLHASGLSRHQTVHTDRVYQCNVCSRKFKDKSSLVRHFKTSTHKMSTS